MGGRFIGGAGGNSNIGVLYGRVAVFVGKVRSMGGSSIGGGVVLFGGSMGGVVKSSLAFASRCLHMSLCSCKQRLVVVAIVSVSSERWDS